MVAAMMTVDHGALVALHDAGEWSSPARHWSSARCPLTGAVRSGEVLGHGSMRMANTTPTVTARTGRHQPPGTFCK